MKYRQRINLAAAALLLALLPACNNNTTHDGMDTTDTMNTMPAALPTPDSATMPPAVMDTTLPKPGTDTMPRR